MSQASSSFHLLDERIQRFIWSKGWSELRDAQELAIEPILQANRDVIISAATAAGKTEAAFFPALTHLLKQEAGGLIVCISPLKALINDQFGRLQPLCEGLDLSVVPWHGDILASHKKRFMAKGEGVLLITPESLEALLCNKGSTVADLFSKLSYFVVDELHAFIGSERGKQLQSLLHRLETALARTVPRIGLSATLGDMQLAADFLRPSHASQVVLVESKSTGTRLKILVKGYEEPVAIKGKADVEDDLDEPITPGQISEHLYQVMRGSNNLIFPNSRREVERYTHLLNKLCEERQVPNEFWPHHGSLSKEIRYETEAALKQHERPASAICTSTLELGIDIGAVKSVAQIGAPLMVAGLRQRLGRSGRREGESAILRGYCIEEALSPEATLATSLRLGLVQMTAMTLLLLENWFEPPRSESAHLSTLIQQMLSTIAQLGGAPANQLYRRLCGPGTPFSGLSPTEFAALLRHLGSIEMLQQDSSGLLLHGPVGERFVNHYSFYAAFTADEEFRIVAGGKTLGSLPVSQGLTLGQRILFAGKTWRIESLDEPQKIIHVVRTSGGAPPLFAGGAGQTHSRVRLRMAALLQSEDIPLFLDPTAQRFLLEAQKYFLQNDLANQVVLDQGPDLYLLTWLGDAANEALACLLRCQGFTVAASGPGVEVLKGAYTAQDLFEALQRISEQAPPSLDVLLADVANLQREKWDWALPDALLRKAYASHNLDIAGALQWVSTATDS
jgi:ATP-dependent Lhr-like helicase